MTHSIIGGALASVLAQIEIPPEVVNLGAVGIVAFAAAIIALALWGLVRTGAPLLRLLSEQFTAMKESNSALLKRLEASDAVIDRNSNVIAGVPIALDKYAAKSQQRAAALSREVVTIRQDVSNLGTTVSEQLDALKAHITETGATNTKDVIAAVKEAAVALEEIKTYSREQNAAIVARVNEVEQSIITALNKLTLPAPVVKQTTEITATTVAKRIETGKLPPVTDLVKPAEPEKKDPAA